MAISRDTSNADQIYVDAGLKVFFEAAINLISSAISWNQGDLLYLDTTAHLIKPVSATGNAGTILGIAQQAITNGVVNGPYDGLTQTSGAPVALVGPAYGVVANMLLNVGDAFIPGLKVYLVDGATSQTVSVTDPGDGNFVGIYVGPAITGAAGVRGQVKLCARPDGATAQF